MNRSEIGLRKGTFFGNSKKIKWFHGFFRYLGMCKKVIVGKVKYQEYLAKLKFNIYIYKEFPKSNGATIEKCSAEQLKWWGLSGQVPYFVLNRMVMASISLLNETFY